MEHDSFPGRVYKRSEQVPTEKLTEALLFDGQYQPWRALMKAPEEINPIPSMIIPDEAQFLHYVAREHYKGDGAIVEFGPLAGGSTHALASGMVENSISAARKGRIDSYDLWEFCEGWDCLFPGRALRPGDDLKEIFVENLSAFHGQINPHKGDLSKQRWSGGSIEIMFIDAAKTPALMAHIVDEFFPHLIPNRSLVVHQDYVSAQCPWIHIIVQHLREYFECMDSPAGGSICVRLKKSIPSGLLAEDFFDKLPVSQARRRLADAREMIVGWYKLSVWLAEANYLASKGLISDALQIIDEVCAHPQFQPHLWDDIDHIIPLFVSKLGRTQSDDSFEKQWQHFVRERADPGRYRKSEQGIWSEIAEIQQLLSISPQVDALINEPSTDRELFRTQARDLFASIKHDPVLAHWATQRIWDAVGSVRPTVDDPQRGHLGFLLGCIAHPVLIEENVDGLNIILYNADYYAIPQGEGGFDHRRVIRGDYSRYFQASTVDTLKTRIREGSFDVPPAHALRGNGQVALSKPSGAWRALKNERTRLGSWKPALRSVGKNVLKTQIITSFGPGGLPRLKNIYRQTREEKLKRGALRGFWFGIKLVFQEGLHPS